MTVILTAKVIVIWNSKHLVTNVSCVLNKNYDCRSCHSSWTLAANSISFACTAYEVRSIVNFLIIFLFRIK